MAEYMLVPHSRLLLPLGDLDPRDAAPLSDAALTPYHAIKRSLHLLAPGSTAVVIGVGGLGHMAVQILRALSPAQVIAVDTSAEKLALAREVGAELISTTSAPTRPSPLLRRSLASRATSPCSVSPGANSSSPSERSPSRRNSPFEGTLDGRAVILP